SFQDVAQKLGAAIGRERAADQIAAELSEKNAALVEALKKAGQGSHVVEHTTDTVVVHDQVPVKETTPTTWDDSEGPFQVDVGKGFLTRNEHLQIEGVVVLGPDGSTKVRGPSVYEISPRTGKLIPSVDGSTAASIKVDSKFDIVKESA